MMAALELLRRMVELESPAGAAQRLNHLGSFLAAELAGLGGTIEREGQHLVSTHGNGRAPILLIAHMDTVWPVGTLSRMPFRIENGSAYGPGSLDMKGGIVVLLEGLRKATPLQRPVEVLITADEEIGSPSGKPLVERLAVRA